MDTALKGIKVIEVASMAAGPSAAVMLADFGAEVIKIEPPMGDPWRFGHLIQGMPPSDIAYTTFIRNRSKKSVALDLKQPEAQAALHKLVEGADVFLTNSPLTVQRACAHTYEAISEVNPGIVYAWVNGFGLAGPDKDLPGFDVTAWYARSGVAEQFRGKDANPVMQPIGLGDTFTATSLFAGIMTGLFIRERTGKGTRVSTSLMNNGLWANSSMMQAALVGAPPMKKYLREEWPQAIMGAIYKTRDERFLIINEMNPNNAAGVLEAVDADHLKTDERFTTAELRAKYARALLDELQKVIGNMELAEVEMRFKKCGVNHGVMQTAAECANDEHMIANGCFPEVEGCDGIRTIDNPIQIEGMEKVRPQKPPAIGGDSMAELLAIGYSEDEVRDMAAAGAVGLPRADRRGPGV